MKQFISPVGGSSVISYFDDSIDSNVGNKEYKELPTKIVVTEGSYAHTQVRLYSQYGLVIEVEGSRSSGEDIDTTAEGSDTSKEGSETNTEGSDVDIEEVTSTIEGAGYSSAEDAILAYAKALKTSDLSKILSTFAIETYVENFDIEAYLDYCKTAFIKSNIWWGKWDGFTEDIGLLNRQNY